MNTEPGAGDVIADFRLLKKLGEGNIGIVYRARQCQSNRDVALKILKPEFIHDKEYIAKFLREARLAARLNHPNIVQAVDFGRSGDGGYFFAMELVEGTSLEDIRLKKHRLPLEELLPVMIQVAEAMAYAWNSHRIIHGDIKPDNILICSGSNIVKLADLGLAQVSGSCEEGNVMATPMYVAPEIISRQRGDAGPRSDIYSFGVMFYELATGEPPFAGELQELLQQHLVGITRSLRERCALPDNSLSDFVSQMLEKEPQYRPESWNEVVAFLKDYRDKYYPAAVAAKAEEKTAVKASAPVSPKKTSYILYSVLGVSFLLFAGVVGWLCWNGIKEEPLELPVEPPMVPVVEPEEEKTVEEPPAAEPVQPVEPVRRRREIVRPVPVEPPPRPEVVQPPKVEVPVVTVKPAPEFEPVRKKEPATPVPETGDGEDFFDDNENKPVQKPPLRRPPQEETVFNERLWQVQSRRAAYLIRELSPRFSVEWKMNAFDVVKESYYLELQILSENPNMMQIIGAFEDTVTNHSTWKRSGRNTGVVGINPRTSPGRIARAIGVGVYDVLLQRAKVPVSCADEFSRCFEFLVMEKFAPEAKLKDNPFYDMSHGNRDLFIKMLQKGEFRRLKR